MPAYKYTLKSGKTLWYANFYYTDWTGEKKYICKRGFKTQREAKEYERSFMDQQHNTSDILFSSPRRKLSGGHGAPLKAYNNGKFLLSRKVSNAMIKSLKEINKLISSRKTTRGLDFSSPLRYYLLRKCIGCDIRFTLSVSDQKEHP